MNSSVGMVHVYRNIIPVIGSMIVVIGAMKFTPVVYVTLLSNLNVLLEDA